MFSRNWGDTVLPIKVQAQDIPLPPPPALHGGVGVGTWHTIAQFKNIKVTDAGKTLFESDFSGGPDGGLSAWKPTKGTWVVQDGTLAQTDPDAEAKDVTGDSDWHDYTLECDALKKEGKEGFLIAFHVQDKNNFAWLNLGGWENSKSGIQVERDGGEMTLLGDYSAFTVESNKWYHIKIECQGLHVRAYVDGNLIDEAEETPPKAAPPLFAAASRVDSTGEVILKVVNTAPRPEQLAVDLQGVPPIAKQAAIEVLQGDPADQNTVEEPTKIAPQAGTIDDAGTQFTHEFPANSVTVIRLKPGT
jgi:alpha-L-arabinofuranosidase